MRARVQPPQLQCQRDCLPLMMQPHIGRFRNTLPGQHPSETVRHHTQHVSNRPQWLHFAPSHSRPETSHPPASPAHRRTAYAVERYTSMAWAQRHLSTMPKPPFHPIAPCPCRHRGWIDHHGRTFTRSSRRGLQCTQNVQRVLVCHVCWPNRLETHTIVSPACVGLLHKVSALCWTSKVVNSRRTVFCT